MIFHTVDQIPNLASIEARLKKRGLVMLKSGDWEKHGPHPGQPYMVIIGPCRYFIGAKEEIWVAIYPSRIYELANPGDWDKGEPIPVLRPGQLDPATKKKLRDAIRGFG